MILRCASIQATAIFMPGGIVGLYCLIQKEYVMKYIRILAVFFLLLWALLWLTGCKQVQYVPVETVRLDSIYLTQTLRDSIYKYDSIYVRDKGDTLYVERWKYLYRDKVRVDTMVSVRVDTVSVPYPVEKELTRWERVKMETGGVAISGFFLLLAAIVAYIVYRSRRK